MIVALPSRNECTGCFAPAIGVGLNTPIKRGLEARFGGVHFSGPPHFGPLGIFFGFFLLNLGLAVPNYSRKPPMRSRKAPLN